MLNAKDYYSYITKTLTDDSFSNLQKHHRIKDLLEWLCKEQTKQEKILLSSLFARIAYIGQKLKLPQHLIWRLQKVRINDRLSRKSTKFISINDVHFAMRGVAEAVKLIYNFPIPKELDKTLPPLPTIEESKKQKENFVEELRVEVIKIDKSNKILFCIEDDDAESEAPIQVKYGVHNLNDMYDVMMDNLWEGVQLHLLNARLDDDDALIPLHFVVEPDYLLDVTAVAESFTMNGSIPLTHLLKKFTSAPSSTPMMLGNVANYFLDEIIHSENTNELSFLDVFTKTFKANPLEYITLPELQTKEGFKKFMADAEFQFKNIINTVNDNFSQQNIDKDGCNIEPSFYSPKYGLQGRLDLLHINKDQSEFRIVELKSGKPPQAGFNNAGLWKNHAAQTLMYQMILTDAYNTDKQNIYPMIFYSKAIQSPLRYDTYTNTMEQAIILSRNQIVINELMLAKADTLQDVGNVLRQINEVAFASAAPFTKTDVNKFIAGVRALSQLERAYLFSFVSFIAKEHQLAKVGDTIFNQGVASLWLDDFGAKKDSFKIFFDLEVYSNQTNENTPELIFTRTNTENAFVNFRVGDIVTIYPRENSESIATKGQINKGTITQMSKDKVHVQLRHKQRNAEVFDADTKWALEGDFMEASFNAMYRGLFNFITWHNKEKKDILLGLKPPTQPEKMFTHEEVLTLAQDKNLNKVELNTLSKALSAEDYCLVVGPPGTGKTSRMLKNLAHILYKTDPTRNILFIAYTNRAVDEICEALDEAIEHPTDDGRKFLRIGSEHSCSPQWRNNLMNKMAEEANNRNSLKKGIEQHRIVVTTLASISGRSSLFRLKDFDMAVIDEASQILEPQLMDLLTRVNRFILIGDQKQLPAITQQDEALSQISFNGLEEINLTDRRTAYFERIYSLCQKNDWNWAFDMLKNQGRMHQQLGNFANEHFYQGNLTTVPLPWQSDDLKWDISSHYNSLEKLLSEKRLLFFPTQTMSTETSDKINMEEARKIAAVAIATKNRYIEQKGEFDIDKTLGIIAPYRNQIAAIRQALEEAGMEEANQLSIDTVERYQGSQREVILISFCANTPFQMLGMLSLTEDGSVDRKLNVAITRAKQQMIFFGSPTILSRSAIHDKLMDWIKEQNGWIENDTSLFS
ncbi:AAA domain-containing protein [Flammeovirga kamogawensis]|uniref:DNA helicase n=1 Tax=Flammeovirga kamogawensis TaxID=373891 RepID=A0ABX8GYJ0_9BACT|nr:AAA domain-containing protein [Flammeovirga kamogawensis]MBB6459114.1 DNA replication ATP-dependent helicase Dna2 [Flammeovirga kamogawensis]QWG08683.1 AAA family ATPase [Flammeovirga kamogawensis]TRX66976.1 AAA family ATPase [Flammeovirga kamogawensis]